LTTLIDVLDTAVKIGLGALISGVATYWHGVRKDKAESAKEYEKRHRTLLEEIAGSVEQLNHVYLKYADLVIEGVRFRDRNKEWPEDRKGELDLVKAEFFSTFKELTSAESKLLLVGEREAYSKMKELGDTLVQFRRLCQVDNKDTTEQDVENKKEAIRTLREQLYGLLSSTYQSNFV
jgi:hypothetical protein